MFTIFDPGGTGIYGPVRGRMAIFNEWVREIADRHDATIVDMWRMRDIEIAGVLDADRMHLNGHGRHHMAAPSSTRSGSSTTLEPVSVEPLPLLATPRPVGGQRAVDPRVPRPWVHRRLTGRSSGDTVSPKRPGLVRALR